MRPAVRMSLLTRSINTRASSRFCSRRLDPIEAFCIVTKVRVTNPRITVMTAHTTTSSISVTPSSDLARASRSLSVVT